MVNKPSVNTRVSLVGDFLVRIQALDCRYFSAQVGVSQLCTRSNVLEHLRLTRRLKSARNGGTWRVKGIVFLFVLIILCSLYLEYENAWLWMIRLGGGDPIFLPVIPFRVLYLETGLFTIVE